MPKYGLIKKLDKAGNFLKAVTTLTKTQVFVGVPREKTTRDEGAISNAALAYIHENGAPEANIPARPFMKPGIDSVKDRIAAELKKTAQMVLKSVSVNVSQKDMQAGLNRAGIVAVNAIRAKISEGIPPPLAESTIKGRIRRVKGKKRRARIQAALDAGTPASRIGGAEGVFTPLVVTGQLRNAITYVLRKAPRK